MTRPTFPATHQGARATYPGARPTYPVPQTRLPYTSSSFKRPPRLGERGQRGVPCTVVIVSSRRVDWCPPVGGWGHGWRDARVGSTFSEIQLTIARVVSRITDQEDFSNFPTYPGAKSTYPGPKLTYPIPDFTYPGAKSAYPRPTFFFLPSDPATLNLHPPTLYQIPPTLDQLFFFTKSDPATLHLAKPSYPVPGRNSPPSQSCLPCTAWRSSRVGEFPATLHQSAPAPG